MENIATITKVTYEQMTFRVIIYYSSGIRKVLHNIKPEEGYQLVEKIKTQCMRATKRKARLERNTVI